VPFTPYLIALAALTAFALLVSILFRRVVSTNVVHIVQRGRTTMPYGTGLDAGNVYYAWP
jgi:flotillin